MEYTVDEVYGLSRNIPLNYVERHDVDERLRCNLNRDKHITIFGSSKQGKTCLRKHCLNENDYILVQCSNRWSLSDLNANILKRAGYELTESTNVTYEGKAKVSASVKILDATLGGEAGGGATKNVTHRQLELDLSDVNDIIGALNEANFHQYIVLEDFHYLKSEVQKDFAIELKTSVYKGYKQDKIEMRGDRAEMSDFPLYLNTVAGGLDRRDQTIGGFSFVVKIYALPVVEIIG